MSTVIKHVRYVMSNVDNNNNKFWYGTWYGDNSVKAEWGRVGAKINSQIKHFPNAYKAENFLNKKGREKEKKGYRQLDVVDGEVGETTTKTNTQAVTGANLQKVALDQIDTDSKQTAALVKYLTKVNAHNIINNTQITYDIDSGLFSTPCGIVTQNSIDKANDLLESIADYIVDHDWDSSDVKNLTQDYLMLVPQKVGRKLNVQDLFPSLSAVQKNKAILDSLQASLDSIVTGKSKKDTGKKSTPTQDRVFAVKLHLVKDNKVINRIKKLYRATLNSIHSCSALKV